MVRKGIVFLPRTRTGREREREREMFAPTAKNAGVVTGCVAVSYLVLYSGFDKASQQYKVCSKLMAIFGFSNVTVSLNELNKVLGLTAMSTVSAACLSAACPCYVNTAFSRQLALYGLQLGAVHGVYSSARFFSRFSGSKRVAMFLGSASMWGLALYNRALGNSFSGDLVVAKVEGIIGKHSAERLAAAASSLVFLHVLRMETNTETGQLVMRPFGKLGLAVAGVTAALTVVTTLLVKKK
jgi:hypothetical protein